MAEVPANLNTKKSNLQRIGEGTIQELGYLVMTPEVAARHYGAQARKLGSVGMSLAAGATEQIQNAAISIEFVGLMAVNSTRSLMKHVVNRKNRKTESRKNEGQKPSVRPAPYSVPRGRRKRNETRRRRINQRFYDLGLNPDRAFADKRKRQELLGKAASHYLE